MLSRTIGAFLSENNTAGFELPIPMWGYTADATAQTIRSAKSMA
jgi:hypothetical protein